VPYPYLLYAQNSLNFDDLIGRYVHEEIEWANGISSSRRAVAILSN
jgi:hypothetical protein